MSLSVKERGTTVATHRHVMVALMEMLARWTPTTPEMEAKLLFGSHLWDFAQHADILGRRTHELRLPLQHGVPPSQQYAALLERVDALTDTKQRIAALYGVVLPGLGEKLRGYRERTDHLMDAPTVRLIDRILQDHERMLQERRELQQELPHLEEAPGDWLAELQGSESSAGYVAVEATGAAAG